MKIKTLKKSEMFLSYKRFKMQGFPEHLILKLISNQYLGDSLPGTIEQAKKSIEEGREIHQCILLTK